MIVTSLATTHNIPSSTRTVVMPSKTYSTTEVNPSKSLRLLSSTSGSRRQPSSTQSSPHKSKNASTLRSSSPLKKTSTPPAVKAQAHHLRQQRSKPSVQTIRDKKPGTNKVKDTAAKDKNDGTKVTNKQVNVISTEPYDMGSDAQPPKEKPVSLNNDIIHNIKDNDKQVSLMDDNAERNNKALEIQLELLTNDLSHERGVVKSMKLEMQQLKEEIIRLQQQSSNQLAEHTRPEKGIDAWCLIEENERLRNMLAQTQADLVHTQEKQKLDEQEWISRYKTLQEENETLRSSQQHTESECIRLMDELLAYEKADSTNVEQKDGIMYRREIEHLQIRLNRGKKHIQDLEETHLMEMEKCKRDMFELECLVESRVFKETELEAALHGERQRIEQLEEMLKEMEDVMMEAMLFTGMKPYRGIKDVPETTYCEICEECGHDIMTCKALDSRKEQVSTSCYCINCDIFDLHSSEECPNQDETF